MSPSPSHVSQAERAFTLIELLIVVAIIAILAAIAVPNFLEAQVRSKLSRVHADLRTLATALEAYCVDQGNYPPEENRHFMIGQIAMLSTPVAYVASSALQDPFHPARRVSGGDPSWRPTYLYVSYNDRWASAWSANWIRKGCVVVSFGQGREHAQAEHYPYFYNHPQESMSFGGVNYPAPAYVHMVYDATNGTKSWGDVGRTAGSLSCPNAFGR